MSSTTTNRIGKSYWNIFALSLVTALVGALCVPALAQSSPQKDALFAQLNRSLRLGNVASPSAAVAAPWLRQAELTSSDGAAYDIFGDSVAVSGSTAVVGAFCHTYSSSTGTCGPGAAYVFVQNGGKWAQQAELTASDGGAGDEFGVSVAVYGNTVVVGANCQAPIEHYGCGPGAAYVFVESGGRWTQQAELTPSDGVINQFFGSSVAVGGSTVVVGSPGWGKAYVFVESGGTWTQQAELTPSDGGSVDDFGSSVALYGSTLVAGDLCHPYSSSGCGPGAAYVFVENGGTWGQQAELTPSDGVAGDDFGASVAVGGSTVMLVGASEHTVGSNAQQGAAYVFVESGGTWSQQAELTASDGVAGDYFGTSVALSGGTAVVGAPCHVGSGLDCEPTPGPGAAYVFVQSGTKWNQQQELTASGVSDGQFGASIAITGNTAIVVGAYRYTVGSNYGQGAAYVFVPPATLTPGSPTYPPQKVGTTSKPRTFTLANNQAVKLTGIVIATTGDFAVSAKTCGTTLAAKSACTVSVTFEPKAKGKRTGKLTINDSASNSPQHSNLTGTGT